MVSVPALLPAKVPFVPAPDQLAAAAGNVAHKLLYGGIADLRPMPRQLIDDGMLRELYHYRPLPDVPQLDDPVLLVMPLAAPSRCYDLRRGCSLVEHLVQQGRPTYLVEYGEISFANRNLGMEHWIETVVPAAVREVSEHAGGRAVHVVAWSLGGTFALLSAAAFPDLPIASMTIFGTPIDISQVPLIAPLRPLVDLTDGKIVGTAVHLLGGAPKPLVRWAFQLSAVQKMVTKPYAQLIHPPTPTSWRSWRRWTGSPRASSPTRGGRSGSSTTGSCAATSWSTAPSSWRTAPSTWPTSRSRCWSSAAPPTGSRRCPRCGCSPTCCAARPRCASTSSPAGTWAC
jgi:pimeloyl-ACP methyl ester carboxylesterase